MRSIVGGPNCPTRLLSQLIDIILKPFLIHLKSYVKDNLDFLRKCSRKNNDSTTLATFNVKSLYKSIPHNYGLEAIRFWIEKHQDSLNSRFSKGFVLESIKIILENNNCTFNDEFYRQISGTIFSPIYATITMGYFEVHFYNICELKWRKEFPELILENWNRFLDDCQTPLDKNKEPEKLLETLNSVNKAIQFSIEFSDKEIPFLDNLIKRDKSGIRMNLNHKPTDTKRCLSYSKIHPKHCLKNISFVMTRHICTIAKNNFLKNKYLRELKENFRIYGYPEKVVQIGLQKALKIPQTELRHPKICEITII